MSASPPITLRPYQLLCTVCSLGKAELETIDEKTQEILNAVRRDPDTPVTLLCNAGEMFGYQDPGIADDTPAGAEFNRKRDLEILYQLNLFPGCTLPARILFHRLLDTIEDVAGICRYPSATADAWRGCPAADRGNYQRGREKGIQALAPPRTEQEMRTAKEESLAAMHGAEAVAVRPHMLLCAVCQYGNGTRPPFPEDNLPELIELVLKKPNTLIRMAPGAEWMMCAPCPCRSAQHQACVNNKGSGGLPNQLRDLRVLQKLGLTYGSTVPARDLYRLVFERIPGTLEICRIEHGKPSVWWTGCGAATTDGAGYEQGKQALMAAW
ncbi:hypothetical protein HQ590_05960 [bacterium]|nr:hypothetical protein [bacterium]